MNMEMKILMPNDNHKSFYGKAKYFVDADGWTWLQSYNTIVCGIKGNLFLRRWKYYTATTQRHVNAFLDLFGKGEFGGKAYWDMFPVGEEIVLDIVLD